MEDRASAQGTATSRERYGFLRGGGLQWSSVGRAGDSDSVLMGGQTAAIYSGDCLKSLLFCEQDGVHHDQLIPPSILSFTSNNVKKHSHIVCGFV
jgi:hypothetical protein